MEPSKLEPIIISPKRPARASVIWLHGLGADGQDFVPIVPQLGLVEELGLRFVFPTAPIRPITLNGGYPMRAWYDLFAIHLHAPEDEPGITASRHLIEQLIQAEQNLGIRSERIVLAGFSQGAAMALHGGLHYSQPLAGILGLSGYLPLANKLALASAGIQTTTPILLAHGVADTVVPLFLAQASYQILQSKGYHVELRTYPLAHTVDMNEINEIKQWLQQVLAE